MTEPYRKCDVLILGAGAAGLMCAIEAGKRGRSVVVMERNRKVGEKIRISGGGRCNFTNLQVTPQNFLSSNPHFCTSALSRYTPADFVALVEKHGLPYFEKTLGQLFCSAGSGAIIAMLLKECTDGGVAIQTGCEVKSIVRESRGFRIETSAEPIECSSLVVATGGLSIPKIGATNFGYRVARQFGLKVTPLLPGLVPMTCEESLLDLCRGLSGVSLPVSVTCNGQMFQENMLFTHRGLSGPAILQCSSYWSEGGSLIVDLVPEPGILESALRTASPRTTLGTMLSTLLPKRFVHAWLGEESAAKPVGTLAGSALESIATNIHSWKITPSGTEGFGKAEVTVGGIDTDELSSKTLEAKRVPGLYCIGEVVDVTGWLGGYNFQWAWSSGFAAGQYV